MTEHCELNKMHPSNLGIVFGPTLMRCDDEMVGMSNMNYQNAMIESMIEQTQWLFERDD